MKTKKLSPFLLLAAIAVLIIIFVASSCKDEPDVVPPTKPSGLSYTATTTTINLSWQASTDNVKVAGYKIYRNGAVVGNSLSTSFLDKNLLPNTDYLYAVSAYDKAGNESPKSLELKARSGDDCPACSKWLSEVSFLAPPETGEIFLGEEKVAGSLVLKNIKGSVESANITLAFPIQVAKAIESFSYTVDGKQNTISLNTEKVFLNDISVAGNSSTKIDLSFKVKDFLPGGVANNSQISLAVIATSTSEAGVNSPGDKVFAGVNLGVLKAYTAKINPAKSYEASSQAEEIELYGNSMAKAFVLEVEEAGLVRIEFVGKKQNGSSPVKYFWVNSKDSEDFNQAVSALSPIIPKTSFGNNRYLEIELKAGTNLIAFKAEGYKGQIANGEEIGLRVRGQNFDYQNSYKANSSANVAEKVRVINRVIIGRYIPKKSELNNASWAHWWIIPEKEDGSYDKSSFPQIRGAGINLEYWAENYPKLYFEKAEGITPEGFDKDFKLLGGGFGEMPDPNNNHWTIISSESLPNNTVKFENNIVVFSANKYYQTYNADKEAVLTMSFNVYNDDGENDFFEPGYTFLDPAPIGWKFLGNPELELWTEDYGKESKRVL